jgi:NADPH-dependent ferric siderophore reductase
VTTQQESQELNLILDEVEVVAVERLSPSFVRVELGGPPLADFGVDGPLYDLRIKLVFPNDAGELPSFAGADESWWDTWLELPEAERGHMRTDTVRAVRGAGADTRIVVDLVLHPAEGEAGPGSAWAEQASVGDRLVTMAPRRGVEYGGIEFAPGTAREVLLVADETAVPAVCSILEDLDDDARGVALLEVPLSADAAALAEQVAPPRVEVVWLPRDGAPLGSLLEAEVRSRLGVGGGAGLDVVADAEVDPDLWETPVYSSSGEDIDPTPRSSSDGTPGGGSEQLRGDPGKSAVPVATVGHDLDGLYAWIAGESKVVTGLRRLLVSELGMDRRQVAFMGYWRRGVAMRS